jgi:hypothetical protein
LTAVSAILYPAIKVLPLGRNAEPRPLVRGSPYLVAVKNGRATVDLDCSQNARYLLVVGSLGSSNREFCVAGSAEPIATLRQIPRPWTPHFDCNRVATVDPDPSLGVSGPCGSGSTPTTSRDSATAARSYAMHVTDGSLDDPNQYTTVHAHCIALGRDVRVDLDEQQTEKELPAELAKSIVTLFDDDVIPRFRARLGSYRDVDGDGRFRILLSPWLSRLQGGRTTLGGFVRGTDFQQGIATPYSNRCDMMYVNSATQPGPHLRTLLIHEYAHAVCFSRRITGLHGESALPDDEDWLNEAIAHCAENLLDGGWTNLDYRIDRYLNDPEAYPLVVDDYYRSGRWRCHGCRGATYLFLRHCVDRFGVGILDRVMTSPVRGVRNIEQATGCRFDQLFRDWTVSLADNRSALKTPAIPAKNETRLPVIDLFGRLGSWSLAGPRVRRWDIASGPLRFGIKGTTAAYVEIWDSGNQPHRRVHLTAVPGMRMQMTVIPIASDSAHADLAVAWAKGTGHSNDRRLRAVVRFPAEHEATLDRISVEQNSTETRGSLCFEGQSLRELEIAATDQDGRFRTFELPVTRLTSSDVPLVVKIVGADREGRRIAATAELACRPSVTPIAGLAHRSR